jgi:hypothetical protein
MAQDRREAAVGLPSPVQPNHATIHALHQLRNRMDDGGAVAVGRDVFQISEA